MNIQIKTLQRIASEWITILELDHDIKELKKIPVKGLRLELQGKLQVKRETHIQNIQDLYKGVEGDWLKFTIPKNQLKYFKKVTGL